MTRDDVLQVLRKRPFQPFRILVVDGAEHEVRHPELVLVDHVKVVVFSPAADQPPPAFEDFEVVPLAEVTRLIPMDRAAV
jgi:hypothetical protein